MESIYIFLFLSFFYICKKVQHHQPIPNRKYMKKIKKLSLLIVCIATTIVSITSCQKSGINSLMQTKTTAADIQNKSLLMQKDSLVSTPFGYKKKSQVHFLPSGHELTESNGRLLEKDSKTKQTINDFGVINVNSGATITNNNLAVTKSAVVPGLGTGWITDAVWNNTNTANAISKFITTWVVPDAPVNNDNQTIYIFNGMQDGVSATSHILQPVLQWGPSNAGGGNYWAATNWYGSGQGSTANYFYGTLVTVSAGTSLQGVMTMTAQNGSLYSYNSSFSGFPANSSMTVTNVPQLTYAFETLEAYGVQYSLDYPMTYEVPMTNIQILLNSGVNAPIQWTAENRVTDIGQHTVIVNNNSPNGEVDIYIRNHYVMPITVTMPSSASLHAVVVGITPAYSGFPGANLTFTNTSTQNYITYNSTDTYNIQVTTVTQRCHVTLNGQTQDTQGGHTYASFNNISLSGSGPLQISVTPF